MPLSSIWSKRNNIYFSEYMKKKTTAVTDLLVLAPHCKQICLAKMTAPKILMPAFLKTELNFCQVLSHLLNSCVCEGDLEHPDLNLCFHSFTSALIGSPTTSSSVTVQIIHCVQLQGHTQKNQLWRVLECTELRISSLLGGWVKMGKQHDCVCFGLARLV